MGWCRWLSVGPLVAVSLAAGGVALAADISAPPASAPSSTFDWTGFYAGVHGGYGIGGGTKDADFLDALSGGIFGAQAGYNVQADPWVAGFETDFAYSGVDESKGGNALELSWLGTTTGRLGYAFDNFLFYGKAGVAYGDVKAAAPGTGWDSAWALGWTAGAGVEVGFTPNVTGRLEYDHVDLGAKTLLPGTPAAQSTGVTSDALKAALNYKF